MVTVKLNESNCGLVQIKPGINISELKPEAKIRIDAIDEFAEKLKAIYPACNLSGWVGNAELHRKIDEIAQQLKER